MILVRHGETDWNREGRIQGWAPVALNERGREQVETLGEVIAVEYSVDRIVASDLYRTRESVEILVDAGVSGETTFDPSWRELDPGVFQGLLFDEVIDRFPAFADTAGIDCLEATPVGGESLADAYERIVTTWKRLCDGLEDETVLVMTHGGPITNVLAHLRGMALLQALESISVGNCALTEITVGESVEIRRELDPATANVDRRRRR